MTDQNHNNAPLVPKTAELLDLPADIDMDTLIAALKKALSAIPDPAKYLPIEAVAGIIKDRSVQSANMSEMVVQRKVEGALRELVLMLGCDMTERLANAPNLPQRIPLAKPWLARYFYSQGEGVSEIARKIKSSDTTVRNWVQST